MRSIAVRSAAVSAATFVLCLAGAGTAAADPLPVPSPVPVATPTLPPVPSPGDIVTTVTSGVDDALARLHQLTGDGTGAPPVASPPRHRHRAQAPVPADASATPAHPRSQHAPSGSTNTTAGAGWTAAPSSFALGGMGTRVQNVMAPDLAPAPAVIQLQAATPWRSPLDSDGPSSSVLRGLLLVLATVAAAALAAGHVAVARTGFGRVASA
jgi:hypothetical protein